MKKRGLPRIDELVLCRVKNITQFAAWCDLIEYDAEGMIHIGEVAGKWVRDIREFVKRGKAYVAKVMKVDPEKKFVNLSLKRVSNFEEREKMDSYRREKRAESILIKAARILGKNLEQAYDEIGFNLIKDFGDLFSAFDEIRKRPKILDEMKISKDWQDALLKAIELSFKKREITIKADLEIKSYEPDGILKIKEALEDLEKAGMNVKYISAPKYRVELKTLEPKKAEKILSEKNFSCCKKVQRKF